MNYPEFDSSLPNANEHVFERPVWVDFGGEQIDNKSHDKVEDDEVDELTGIDGKAQLALSVKHFLGNFLTESVGWNINVLEYGGNENESRQSHLFEEIEQIRGLALCIGK